MLFRLITTLFVYIKLQAKVITNVLPKTAAKTHPYEIRLTSYGFRAKLAHLAVQSLMDQMPAPSRVTLTLTKSDFNSRSIFLRLQEKRGLIIEVMEDFGPHKKWYLSQPRGNHHPIIIADDDASYPKDWAASLIHCFEENGSHLLVANKLKKVLGKQEDQYKVAVGVYGVVFPRNFLLELSREISFQEVAPMHDDVWLSLHAERMGFEILQNQGGSMPSDLVMQTYWKPLFSKNNSPGSTQRTLSDVNAHLDQCPIVNFSQNRKHST